MTNRRNESVIILLIRLSSRLKKTDKPPLTREKSNNTIKGRNRMDTIPKWGTRISEVSWVKLDFECTDL
jgi:hypothetical protein